MNNDLAIKDIQDFTKAVFLGHLDTGNIEYCDSALNDLMQEFAFYLVFESEEHFVFESEVQFVEDHQKLLDKVASVMQKHYKSLRLNYFGK